MSAEFPVRKWTVEATVPEFELMRKAPALRAALETFCDTIENTGGVAECRGLYAPVDDPDWIDLGDAYVKACAALGRTPMAIESELG